MVFDISVVATWILFLALTPISLVWLRRARRILRSPDFSEMVTTRDEASPNVENFAAYEMAIMLAARAEGRPKLFSASAWHTA